MTRRIARPELTTDFQRRNWDLIDVYGRIERALARAEAEGAHERGSAA